MLFSRSKSKIATTITLLLLFATLFMTCFSVKAQDENQPHGGTPGASAFPSSPPAGVTPDLITTVTPYLSFRPNPIGKGQSLQATFGQHLHPQQTGIWQVIPLL